MPKVDPAIETFARIKVVGVGGAGGAAINRMVDAGVTGVDFVAINTDAQALHHNRAGNKVHIGKDATKGLGAGADPVKGQQAAEESRPEIEQAIKGADMVFVTIGAGGGTGSGAGHIVAELAKDSGALVVGFATKPFAFEGEKRRQNAEVAIDKMRKNVDTMITIPNDKLLTTIDRRTPLLEAFKVADDVLRQGVQGISDLITVHGLINLDFADVKAVMADAGSALMGIGRASGENRAIEAATQAISSPLLEAFKVADDVLRQGVQGISDLITVHGLINLDFADVKAVMADAGSALMGIGRASGENRAIEAATQAISSPLLEVAIDGARGILFNVIGGNDMSMHEINTVAETITAAADSEANVIFGATINPDLEGEIIVTVVATGFDDSYYASRDAKAAELLRRHTQESLTRTSQVDDEAMKGLDMELKEPVETTAEDFHSDDTPNIWALPSDDVNGVPQDEEEEEDELDKPSFLRRLTGRAKKDDNERQAAKAPADDSADEDDQDADDKKPEDDKDQPDEAEPDKSDDAKSKKSKN